MAEPEWSEVARELSRDFDFQGQEGKWLRPVIPRNDWTFTLIAAESPEVFSLVG